MRLASGNGWLEPELRRIDALIEFQLFPDQRERASEMLRLAARLACEMGSPVFERRCLLSLREIGEAAEENDETQALRQTAHLDNLKALLDSIVGTADTLTESKETGQTFQ